MSGLFGSGKVSQSAPAISSLLLQTSCWGRPVPLVYGQSRVAPNLIWYGDFTSIATTTSSGGKGGGGGQTSTTYTYTVAVILGLSYGPITAITKVWAGKKQVTLGSLNLTAALGTAGQAAPSFMTTNHPSQALGYSLLAYVSTPTYQLGSNASLPNHTFEVQGLLYNSTGVVGIPDAAPDQVLNDLLYDANHGAGFTSGLLASLTQMQTYCRALGIWISPAYIDRAMASDHIDKLLQIANCAAVFSDGQLKIIPYGDAVVIGNGVTFTPVSTVQYALTDDDFQSQGQSDPIIVTRSSPADAFNAQRVQFKDRANQYVSNIAEAKSDADIALYGLRYATDVTFDELCDANAARMVAQLILQRSLSQRNIYKFKLGLNYCRLEPMDIVTLHEFTGTFLNKVPVRIISIEEATDLTLSIEAEDYLGTVGSAPAYSYEAAGQGYSVDYNAAPGSVNAPFIFDAPGRLTALGYEVWVAAAGTGPLWGGADVWMSTDGNSYKVVGRLPGPARYGVSTATFAVGSDPDTTNTLAVDLTASLGQLTTGTQGDADNLNTISIIDSELVSFQTATFTSANHYTLQTYLRRGVYGTAIAAHSSGAKFARLDTGIFKVPYDPLLVGSTLYFKFTSINSWGAGEEGLATVPAYTYQIQGPIGAPADVTGVNITVVSDGLQVVWNAVPQQNLMHYEIRQGGTDWNSATYIGKTLTTLFHLQPQPVGTVTIWVKALDKQGRYSINAGSDSQSIIAPTAPTVTAQIVDNNVLLSWTAAITTQPILTYEIRKGTTFAGAAIIGTKSGLFTSVFELAAGTYTYWVVAIDIALNYGTPASFTASVNGPPDYILKSLFNSTFTGTFSNSQLDHGAVVEPIDIATQYQTHFTTPAWTSPQDQVTAGFPIFIEKALATGYYEEVFDCGSSTAAAQITVAANTVSIGSPGITCQISTSPDNVVYTTLAAGFSGFGSTFRYVKVRLTATSSAGADLYIINTLSVRVEAKLKSDSGTVSAASGDAGGTTTTFNIAFQNVVSITVTPQSTTAVLATSDFTYSTINPTTFKTLLWTTGGARATGTVNWSARGY